MNNQEYIELAAVIIALFALIISYLSLRESRKARKELGQAFLSMQLVQTTEGLYVVLNNIGNTYAYDVKITNSENFVNGFENLSNIQPGFAYRCLLLNSSNISGYPEKIIFRVQYHDYYSPKHFIKKKFEFKIIDFLKYNTLYNKDFNCYDIQKSF